MSRRFVVALLLGALALAPGFALAQESGGSLEEIMAETAHTKAEHQALAKYYGEQASQARALAARHKSMGRSYLGGGRGQNRQPFMTHCNKIAEQQEAIAKEYDSLAKLHEDEAKKAAE